MWHVSNLGLGSILNLQRTLAGMRTTIWQGSPSFGLIWKINGTGSIFSYSPAVTTNYLRICRLVIADDPSSILVCIWSSLLYLLFHWSCRHWFGYVLCICNRKGGKENGFKATRKLDFGMIYFSVGKLWVMCWTKRDNAKIIPEKKQENLVTATRRKHNHSYS